MRRFLLAGLGLGLLLGLLLPATASACSCAAVSDRTLLGYADAAFAGTVTTATAPPSSDPFAEITYTLRVDTTVKGAPRPEQQVVTSGSSASCGTRLDVGRRYLVLATEYQGRLSTGLCSGTRPLAPGSAVPDLSMPIPRRPHPVWWIGENFEGLRLTRVREVNGRVAFDYRTFGPGVALSIRTVPFYRARAANLVQLTGVRTIRGVPAGDRIGVLTVFTGRQQVRILGERALALRVAAALERVGRPATRNAPLPAPPSWATSEGLGCPSAPGEARPPGCPVISDP